MRAILVAFVAAARGASELESQRCSATEVVEYDGFKIWLDCSRRGPRRFSYLAEKDVGDLPRKKKFKFDKNVSRHCQQKSTAAYGSQYDRGHMVPANHLDHLELGIGNTHRQAYCSKPYDLCPSTTPHPTPYPSAP
jgi:DNA/RNA endonuclease G (NUC1)